MVDKAAAVVVVVVVVMVLVVAVDRMDNMRHRRLAAATIEVWGQTVQWAGGAHRRLMISSTCA